MDCAARTVMDNFKDIVLGFGESDEFRHALISCLLDIFLNGSFP